MIFAMRHFRARNSLRLIGGLVALVFAFACRSAAAEVWLAGVDPTARHELKVEGESDYGDLFQNDAPWPRASVAVRVFKISTRSLLVDSDDSLRRMFANLSRRGMELGLETLMIPQHQACGSNVEGYSAAGAIAAAALRVKRLGGELHYAAMDEPLWYGHRYAGANACRDTIDAVARQLAENVAVLKSVFPKIEIGDIEPFASSVPPDWGAEILQFAAAYRAATGAPLAFVQLDLHWSDDWRPFLADLVPRLRGAGIRYGLIYNGDPADETDLAWTRHAEERFELVEQNPALKPDDAILQTWMAHPTHMLPETEPGTMTNLVLRYLAATHTR
jgi:hypothetical protein